MKTQSNHNAHLVCHSKVWSYSALAEQIKYLNSTVPEVLDEKCLLLWKSPQSNG
ncbi:hypothetical protein P7K49_012816, partial [Saguinus oedipus]